MALEWADLGDWLAPLNIASGFRLLVVGATCYGLGAITAMTVNKHAAPFVACIGFSTSVGFRSLREAMKEFYRSLKRDDDLLTSLANANRELGDGKMLDLTSSVKLAYRVLRGVYDEIRTPQATTEKVQKLIGAVRAGGLHVEASFEAAMPALLEERTRAHSQLAWDRWFPRDVQDQSPYYRLDWSIVEMDLP